MGKEWGREVAEFLRGDPSAVAGVCETVEKAVRGFRFSDPSLNMDLTQEALTRIFHNLRTERFRGEASLRTYSGRVARYTCLEHLRRKRLEVEIDADSLLSSERWSQTEQSFLSVEEHLQNLEVFARLPRDSRELLRMVFVDSLSYREIGLRLGISPGAVKTRVHRCREVFRQAIGMRKPLPAKARKPRAEQGE